MIVENLSLDRLESVNIGNSTQIRILKKDAYALSDIKACTGLPMCRLIHIAIPLLREKLGIKSDIRGNNGGSKL